MGAEQGGRRERLLDEKVSNEYKAEKQGVFREERAGTSDTGQAGSRCELGPDSGVLFWFAWHWQKRQRGRNRKRGWSG